MDEIIYKPFYSEEDYKVVLNLLRGIPISDEDKERVRTRQLFLLGVTNGR